MPVYQIDHETVYDYSLPVLFSNHLAHLLPREVPRQHWISHRLEIEPFPAAKQERLDIFGNRALAFSVEEEHQHFRIQTSGVVDVRAEDPPKTSPPWEDVVQQIEHGHSAEELDASMYAFPSPFANFDDSVKNYAKKSFTAGRPLFECASELMTRIYTDCYYTPGATRIGAMPAEILRGRKGVCQDFAHLMIGCLRSLHLPCRYISGYLRTYPPKGEKKLFGSDASHAWVSVFFPGHGWVEFDPTNNILGGSEHIIIAWGRDFGDVSPLKGVITGGGPHTLKVAVNVDLKNNPE